MQRLGRPSVEPIGGAAVDQGREHPAADTKGAPQGLNVQSVSDFAGYFKKSTYEDGVQTDILDHLPKFANDRIMKSRLRNA